MIYFGPFGWTIHTDALKFIAYFASDQYCDQYCDWKRKDIIFFGVTFAFKEAEKPKMKDEGGCIDWFLAVWGFCFRTDRQTNRHWWL